MAAKTQTSDCPGLGLGLGDAGECSYDYALGRDTTKLGLWEDNREEELDLFTIVTNPPEHMFRNTNNNNNTSTNVAQLLKTINSKALLEKSSHA